MADETERETLYSNYFASLCQTLIFTAPEHRLKQYRCGHCQRICPDSLVAQCGHLYCGKCFLGISTHGGFKKGSSYKCSIDNTLLNQELRKDYRIENEIYNLNVFCPYKSNGCKEITKLRLMLEHMKSCNNVSLICPQGCKRPVQANELQRHLKQFCSHRHVMCEFCRKDFVLAFQQKHLLECPRLPVTCPNNCGKGGLLQADIQAHLLSCKKKILRCKYQYIGCEFKGNEKVVGQHQDNIAEHFHLVAELYSRLNLQYDIVVQETKGETLVLQSENIAVRTSVKSVMDKLERLQEANYNLAEKIANLQVYIHKLFSMHENGRKREFALPNGDDDLCPKSIAQELQENHILMEMVQELKANDEKQDLEMEKLSAASYDGMLLWKITEYQRRKADSLSGKHPSIYSEPFFTGRFGYKLCCKVYLGGEGEGRYTHVSVYVCVMQGPWDDALTWPLSRKISISLVDQKNECNKVNVKECFMPNAKTSFLKPTGAAGTNVGTGISKFVSHATLEGSGNYLKNDTIFIKVDVRALTVPQVPAKMQRKYSPN